MENPPFENVFPIEDTNFPLSRVSFQVSTFDLMMDFSQRPSVKVSKMHWKPSSYFMKWDERGKKHVDIVKQISVQCEIGIPKHETRFKPTIYPPKD